MLKQLDEVEPQFVRLGDASIASPFTSKVASVNSGKYFVYSLCVVYRARGLGSIPGPTNTQGLKIIEEKMLPLL